MATQHVDAILTNPLLAVKPRRRTSDPTALDVLRDPMGWFLNEIALGAASLSKADMCLEVLGNGAHGSPELRNGRTPASIIVEWLQTSQLDTCKEFLECCVTKQGNASKFAQRLVGLVAAQDEMDAFWQWFSRSLKLRMKETGLDFRTVMVFKSQLLVEMVKAQTSTSIDDGMSTFMKAFQATESAGDSRSKYVGPAGAQLVNHITRTQDLSASPELYTSFLNASRQVFGKWGAAVESMLWVHHPTQPNAMPGLYFLQDPAGAISHVESSRSRRKFLVQLSLGVAHQLMEKEDYRGAQIAMQFTKDHLSDLVLATPAATAQQEKAQQNERAEKANLELLDRLVPA